tara:strand:+ start:4786 stop:5073 length:288 start_codon:yes stop_codon:yes gene_type:complete
MAKHLKYCIPTAYLDAGETGNPATVMRSLGITWQHATPQSIDESYWFWNCENVPEDSHDLPIFINERWWNPMHSIGHGLTKTTAEKIRDYEKKEN